MSTKPVRSAGENLVLFLALVPYVMDRGEVSVAEAAKQFARSEADIRRAVELIACAGIPGDSAAYLHADLFDIDWDALESEGLIRFQQTLVIESQPQFSPRELAALIAGLQYVAAHPRYGEREDVQRLLGKLRRASGQSVADTMVVKSSQVEASRELLASAIDRGHRVSFDYVSASGESETRQVDPIALEARDDVWYLRGWCHTRQALRVFRLDRMAAPEELDDPVVDHPDVDTPESWQIFQPSDSDLMVTVECDEQALPIIAEYLDRASPPELRDGRYSATIPFAHQRSLVRFAAAHSGLVRIIGPEAAKKAVAAYAQAALDQIAG